MTDPNAPAVHGLHLVVADLEAARATLLGNGVGVSEVSDLGSGVRYAYFNELDGNSWALPQVFRLQAISPAAMKFPIGPTACLARASLFVYACSLDARRCSLVARRL